MDLGFVATVLLAAQPRVMMDRQWDALPPGPLTAQLKAGARCLEDRQIDMDGVVVDASRLRAWSAVAEDAHPERALREASEKPVRIEGFLRFLDDLCRTPGIELAVLTGGRARKAGIFVSTKAVYRGEPDAYGGGELALDEPLDYRTLEAPPDGAVVSPNWAARFLEPESDDAKLEALESANPSFGRRVRKLIEQLRPTGARVAVESAVRSRARGYLLFGSYWLGHAETPAQIEHRLERLEHYQTTWAQSVPIRWRHPDGDAASVAAARALADTYGVVYATYGGARSSKHYDGDAVDLSVTGLPRRLSLKAPDGATRTFDLSDPSQPRDLSLTPILVEWVEAHFGFTKLRLDYPHWSDAS